MHTTKAPPDLHHQGYKTTLEFHRARTGFFELPMLGARTLALVAGQGLAGHHRRRSHTALIHTNIRVEAGVEVKLLETRLSMAAIQTWMLFMRPLRLVNSSRGRVYVFFNCGWVLEEVEVEELSMERRLALLTREEQAWLNA